MSGAATLPPPAARPDAVSTPELRDEVVRLASRVTEASERLRVALRQKERLSRLLDEVLESLKAGVVLLDEQDRLVAANGAAHEIGAVTAGDEHGVPSLAPFMTDVARAAGETIVRPPHAPASTWIVRPGAVTLPEGGRGRLLLVQDATRLVTAEERSHRRSRLEMLGRMAAELAHEVRNPLGSLELFASVLTEDLEDGSETHEMAEQLLLGVRALSGTVTRFLGAARGGGRTPSPVDAAEVVARTVDMLRPLAFARGIELDASVPDGPCVVPLDAEGIRQALLNLGSNALDATPEGGRVEIRLVPGDESIAIEVADSGAGIPPEHAARVFEPFFTTRGDGTGLGLAVVERVALEHGGRVELLESGLGGAEFRIRVPCAAGIGSSTGAGEGGGES